jgi:cell division protein FtsZ
LPPVVQRQVRIHRGEQSPPPTETRRKSLLEKLAAFGITRQEEAAEPAPRAAPVLPAPPTRAPPPQTHADYGHGRPQPRALAPRVAQGALDPHGRAGVKQASLEEDQLEIPAFLRRQSS